MNQDEDLWEVDCGDGTVLILGASTNWKFALDGTEYSLPILLWMHGTRQDEDHITLDSNEPFVDLARAVEVAPGHVAEILDSCEAMVANAGADITIIGFGPRHPYRSELKDFLAEATRLRRRLRVPRSDDVVLTGRATFLHGGAELPQPATVAAR
ncbi:MAG: hypothetical protein ACR2GX_05315 [Candidatus Dormibacteria bacterium]